MKLYNLNRKVHIMNYSLLTLFGYRSLCGYIVRFRVYDGDLDKVTCKVCLRKYEKFYR